MGTLILFQILMCALVVGDWYLVLTPRSVEIYVSVLFYVFIHNLSDHTDTTPPDADFRVAIKVHQ